MKYVFALLVLFACAGLHGQALDALPTIDEPQDFDKIHTYTRGFSAALRLDTLRKYFAADIVEGIATSPYTSIPDSLRGRFFTSTSDSLYYVDYNYNFYNLTPGTGGGGGAVDTFSLRDPILRMPTAGTTIGGNSFSDWAQWHYFTAPTLSLSGSSPTNEVGTSNSYTYTNTTTNSGGATLSGGRIEKNSVSVATFGAATTGSYTYTFAPTSVVTETMRSEQEWSGAGESGTAVSSSRTLRGVYPVFYGVSATDYSASGNIYSVLTKLVATEGNKTVTMDGSGFIYYAVPVAWSDENLSSIIDANGFNVTPSFTSYTISVTSTGLVNNYTVNYLLYKLNTTTTVSNANYTFNR